MGRFRGDGSNAFALKSVNADFDFKLTLIGNQPKHRVLRALPYEIS